jgi:N-acetylglucosamine-6-phosphate deacetylase
VTRLGVASALVAGRLVEGDVDIEDGRIGAVGVHPEGMAGIAVPGLVDLQVNGFAGVDFLSADADGYRQAGRALAATGVTAYQPTFISSPPDAYRHALAVAASLEDAPGGPRIAGVHLEGPFLSVEHCGAHDPAYLRPPDPALVTELLAAGPVRSMTIAPELPGALDLIKDLAGRGVVVSLGHSGADNVAAHAGFQAGATTVTHLFNAMRRFGHRDPGLAGAALSRGDVVVQIIVDGVHLAAETTRVVLLAARGRVVLVTDAIAAAGAGPGRHQLGDREVDVAGAEARLPDGTLAGSVLTMDAALRNVVALGAPFEEAVQACTETPARLLGRTDLGRLVPGGPADLVVLDDALAPRRTITAGVETFVT